VTSQLANASTSLLRARSLRTHRCCSLVRRLNALGAESERLVRQALDRMADQRTTIVIAHRFATVQKTEFLLNYHPATLTTRIMENGWSAEQVCIRTARAGLYARFAALQFSRRHGEDGKAASLTVAPERA